MEANNKHDEVRQDVVLRPIANNLTDQQVLELYHSGRRFYVEEEEDEEVIMLMGKAFSRTLRCSRHIARGRNADDVRTYYKKVFGGSEREEAISKMRDASKRKQFICEQVGILMELGIIFGNTRDIAIDLSYNTLTVDTRMRYIRRGREKWRNLVEDFDQSV